jgi:hypothetical protein
MINNVIDNCQKVIEAARIDNILPNPPLPQVKWFNFSRLEDFELHSEVNYPICLVNVRTSSAQIEGTMKTYEVSLMCLSKIPIRDYTETDNQFQKKIDEILELYKKFIQHVCYFLTNTNYSFYYTLENDLVSFNDVVDFTEWALIGVEGNFTLSTNTGGFVCELTFDESLFI